MEHKILITGTMGAGKTTAIGQISEIPPVSTDVTNTRRDEHAKHRTTAAFDYGELDLGDDEVLRIYGTPGQERFSFMLPILAKGAIGIIYLIDFSRDEPIADLMRFIDNVGAASQGVPAVVAINKIPPEEPLSVDIFQEFLELRDLDWPVVRTDVRDREAVVDIVELLLSLGEARAESEEV